MDESGRTAAPRPANRACVDSARVQRTNDTDAARRLLHIGGPAPDEQSRGSAQVAAIGGETLISP